MSVAIAIRGPALVQPRFHRNTQSTLRLHVCEAAPSFPLTRCGPVIPIHVRREQITTVHVSEYQKDFKGGDFNSNCSRTDDRQEVSRRPSAKILAPAAQPRVPGRCVTIYADKQGTKVLGPRILHRVCQNTRVCIAKSKIKICTQGNSASLCV